MIKSIWIIPTLLLLAFAASPAFSDSFSFGVGIVRPESYNTRIWWSAAYRISLAKHFALEPEIGYWRVSFTHLIARGSVLSLRLRGEDFTTGINAVFEVPAEKILISFGGGGSAHFLRADYIGIDPVRPSIPRLLRMTRTDPGLQLMGSIDLAVSKRITIFLAARTDIIHHAQDTSKIYGGTRFRFD